MYPTEWGCMLSFLKEESLDRSTGGVRDAPLSHCSLNKCAPGASSLGDGQQTGTTSVLCTNGMWTPPTLGTCNSSTGIGGGGIGGIGG
ncbi:hypothetical protein TELCIR_24674, partial [Teladorsagia circumcincta]